MLKRNTILLFVFVVMLSSVNAQVRPGIKAGYNIGGVMADRKDANQYQSPANPNNFRMKSGFQVGMIADCPINDVLAIQPGARFTMQGFIDKYRTNEHMAPGSGQKATRRFSLFYLQVPVYAQYRWNVYEETNVLFQAGPYFGYGLFGRQSYMRNGKSQDLNDSQKKISFGSGSSKDIRNGFDYGIGAGVGIEFFRFQVMATYDFGLYKMDFEKNAKSGDYNIGMRNHNLSITFAVIFGRRDPLQGKDSD